MTTDVIKGGKTGVTTGMVHSSGSDVKNAETIEVKKAQFDAIMARLEALEKEKSDLTSGKTPPNSEWKEVEAFTGKRKAQIRFLDGNYLIDWKFSRKEWNDKLKEMEQIYETVWLTPDNKQHKMEMSLSALAKVEDRHDVVLEEKDSKTYEKITGKTRKAEIDYDAYKTNYGSLVDTKIVVVVTTWLVTLPDGRKIKLPESRLNA